MSVVIFFHPRVKTSENRLPVKQHGAINQIRRRVGVMSDHRVSKVEKLALVSKVEEIKTLAARFEEDRAAVETTTQKRDESMRKYLEAVLDFVLKLPKRPKTIKLLGAKYGKLPASRKPESFVMQLTYPKLIPKTRSKYAKVVRYASKQNGSNRSIRKVLRNDGGINGCVEKEKLRKRAEANEKTVVRSPTAGGLAAGGLAARAKLGKHANKNEKTAVKGSGKPNGLAARAKLRRDVEATRKAAGKGFGGRNPTFGGFGHAKKPAN